MSRVLVGVKRVVDYAVKVKLFCLKTLVQRLLYILLVIDSS